MNNLEAAVKQGIETYWQQNCMPSYDAFQKFKGSTNENISDYLKAFERLAKSQRWDNTRKAEILPIYLEGRASDFFETLTENVQNDWKKLCTALTGRFVPKLSRETALEAWRNRVQGPQETSQDLADEIALLAQKAFAGNKYSTQAKDELTKFEYLRALHAELSFDVRMGDQEGAMTFDQVVDRAAWLEACRDRIGETDQQLSSTDDGMDDNGEDGIPIERNFGWNISTDHALTDETECEKEFSSNWQEQQENIALFDAAGGDEDENDQTIERLEQEVKRLSLEYEQLEREPEEYDKSQFSKMYQLSLTEAKTTRHSENLWEHRRKKNGESWTSSGPHRRQFEYQRHDVGMFSLTMVHRPQRRESKAAESRDKTAADMDAWSRRRLELYKQKLEHSKLQFEVSTAKQTDDRVLENVKIDRGTEYGIDAENADPTD